MSELPTAQDYSSGGLVHEQYISQTKDKTLSEMVVRRQLFRTVKKARESDI